MIEVIAAYSDGESMLAGTARGLEQLANIIEELCDDANDQTHVCEELFIPSNPPQYYAGYLESVRIEVTDKDLCIVNHEKTVTISGRGFPNLHNFKHSLRRLAHQEPSRSLHDHLTRGVVVSYESDEYVMYHHSWEDLRA